MKFSHNNIQLFCYLFWKYNFNPSHSNHFSVAMETAKLCMHRGSNFQITNYSVSHDTIHIFIAVFHVIVFDSHAIHPLRRQEEWMQFVIHQINSSQLIGLKSVYYEMRFWYVSEWPLIFYFIISLMSKVETYMVNGYHLQIITISNTMHGVLTLD